jgi:hypothetical protein
MNTVELASYLKRIQARKAALAPGGDMPAMVSCRNGGARRTEGKRSALARAETRAKAAGVKPVPADY